MQRCVRQRREYCGRRRWWLGCRDRSDRCCTDLDDDVFAVGATALSDEQAAFLEQLADLPPIGRFDDTGIDTGSIG